MVTFIATNPDSGSEGTPEEWAQAVIDAKHGDDKSVVMLSIFESARPVGALRPHRYAGQDVPVPSPRGCLAADYGPAFVEAASLVETACAGFTPPPG
jgi:hypothetical protein